MKHILGLLLAVTITGTLLPATATKEKEEEEIDPATFAQLQDEMGLGSHLDRLTTALTNGTSVTIKVARPSDQTLASFLAFGGSAAGTALASFALKKAIENVNSDQGPNLTKIGIDVGFALAGGALTFLGARYLAKEKKPSEEKTKDKV